MSRFKFYFLLSFIAVMLFSLLIGAYKIPGGIKGRIIASNVNSFSCSLIQVGANEKIGCTQSECKTYFVNHHEELGCTLTECKTYPIEANQQVGCTAIL